MLDPEQGGGLRALPDVPQAPEVAVKSVRAFVVGASAEETAALEAAGFFDARELMFDVACELDELVALGGDQRLRLLRDRLRAGARGEVGA